MKKENYYEILKIAPTATNTEIKEAYKKLVKKYHPDLYLADKEFAEQKIKEINEAFKILSDSEMKAEYDNYLSDMNSSNTIDYTNTSTHSDYAYQSYSEPTKSQEYYSKAHNFLLDHFNKLDSKYQKIIFVLFMIFICIMIFITLKQLKSIFSPETDSTNNESNYNTTTDSFDFTDYDSYFNELFTPNSST